MRFVADFLLQKYFLCVLYVKRPLRPLHRRFRFRARKSQKCHDEWRLEDLPWWISEMCKSSGKSRPPA